jgi:hypothetical protein
MWGRRKRQPDKTELCHAIVISKMPASFTTLAVATQPSGNSGMVENKELSALDPEDQR